MHYNISSIILLEACLVVQICCVSFSFDKSKWSGVYRYNVLKSLQWCQTTIAEQISSI